MLFILSYNANEVTDLQLKDKSERIQSVQNISRCLDTYYIVALVTPTDKSNVQFAESVRKICRISRKSLRDASNEGILKER